MTMLVFPFLTSLSQHLTLILRDMRAVVVARAERDQAIFPTAILVWVRLGRMAARFEALVARVLAGKPTVKRVWRGQVAPAESRPGGAMRVPMGHGWVVGLMPETAAFSEQVEALLRDPTMAALLAAAPQAGRVLRPLCRMLGIAPWPALGVPPAPTPRPPTKVRRDELSAISLIWAAFMTYVPVVAAERTDTVQADFVPVRPRPAPD